MQEKLKQLIAELLIRNGNLKILLRNRITTGEITEDELNEILDLIAKNNDTIKKLNRGLK